MPLYWNISFVIVVFIMLVMLDMFMMCYFVKFYFYNKNKILNNIWLW